SYMSQNIERLKDDRANNTLLFLAYLSVRLHHTSLRRDGLFRDAMWDDLESIGKHISKKGHDVIRDLHIENMTYKEFCDFLDIEHLKNNKRHFEYIPLMFDNGRIKDARWYFILIYIF